MLTGVATSYQPGINAKFAQFTPSKLHGGVVNFAVGLAAMLLVCAAVRTPLPEPARLAQAPWWSWTGGLLGAFWVTMSLVLVPRLGAANYISAVIAGQMVGSLVIDHFGHLGLAVREVTPGRVLGVVLIVAGVGCVKWL